MKKIMIMVVAAMCMMSCGNNTKKQDNGTESADSTVVERDVFISDSTRKENEYAQAVVCINMPGGDDMISTRIRKGLKELAYNCLSVIDHDNVPLFARAENESSTEGVSPNYCQYVFDCIEKMSKKDYDRGVEEGWADDKPMQYLVNYSIKPLYETSRLALYVENTTLFYGGAHGMYYARYYTFDKQDGYMFNDFLKPNCQDAMQPMIKEGLKNYFRECGYEMETDEELMECLLLMDDVIPLPMNNLCLSKDGIVLVYQPYEIAPYSEGCISVTCPYNKVKPYLTDKACELLGI